MKRTRIKKPAKNVEFCYSTAVLGEKNSISDEIRSELTRLNQKEYSRQRSNNSVEYVEFEFFGKVIQRPAEEIKDSLKKANITFRSVWK